MSLDVKILIKLWINLKDIHKKAKLVQNLLRI